MAPAAPSCIIPIDPAASRCVRDWRAACHGSHHSRHGVVAAMRPWVAAQDAPRAKPAALQDAVFLNRLVGIHRAARRVDAAWRQQRAEKSLVAADQKQKRPVDDLFHWRSVSHTRCGICGIINFSSASRTAPVEPGRQNTHAFPCRPAVARDSMAAAPICS